MTADPSPTFRDMWLSEMWGKCPEVSYGERVAKRKTDRKWQREMEERDVLAALPQAGETVPVIVDRGAA